MGAVDRALYELLSIDVYGLLDLDVASYDTASCPAGVISGLRQMLGRPSVAGWNDHACPGQAAAAQLPRDTAKWVDLGADEAATTRSL